MAPQRVIGVDLGGTKIATGSVDADGGLHERHEVPTSVESQEALLDGIVAAVEHVGGEDVRAVGLGVPSVIDPDTGKALGSVNIPLRDVALRDVLQERLGLPVFVGNDGNVAALAEWKLGAGRDADDLVMLTLGTGVGGGVVLDSSLFHGIAELGHVVVVADGPPCQGNCAGRGHLEVLASGNAADRAAERLWGEGATAELLVGRAEEGDAEAIEALAGMGHLLGAAIGSFVNTFAPELVIIGGGFGLAAYEFLVPTATEIARREIVVPDALELRIVKAELGSDAGLVGAGLLALETVGGG
jgi:glucokinase